MALAMHRTQIEELVTERIALAILIENGLQRHRKLAQSLCLRPRSLSVFVCQRNIGEEPSSSARAFIEAGQELVGKGAAQRVELTRRLTGVQWGHTIVSVHNSFSH